MPDQQKHLEMLARYQSEREERLDGWRSMKTSELLLKVIEYKIWAGSGESSWAPCSFSQVEEMLEIIDERMPIER